MYLLPSFCILAGASNWEAPVWAVLIQMGVASLLHRWRTGLWFSHDLYQRNYWLARIALASACWTLLTPLVLTVHGLTVWFYEQSGTQPQQHPLTQIDTTVPYNVVLLIIQACIAAPWVEEYLLRGLVLPWLIAAHRRDDPHPNSDPLPTLPRWVRPWLVMGLAWGAAQQATSPGALWLWFTLAAGLAVLQCTRFAHRRHWVAIYVSATLFALLHSHVWPSPIPLWLLGMGLGWLAVWTRGITSAVFMHAMFNLVSTLYLLLFPADEALHD
jgi:membrane protease YdiL (CAAX protease family)